MLTEFIVFITEQSEDLSYELLLKYDLESEQGKGWYITPMLIAKMDYT